MAQSCNYPKLAGVTIEDRSYATNTVNKGYTTVIAGDTSNQTCFNVGQTQIDNWSDRQDACWFMGAGIGVYDVPSCYLGGKYLGSINVNRVQTLGSVAYTIKPGITSRSSLKLYDRYFLASIDFTISPSRVFKGTVSPSASLIYTATRTQPDTSTAYIINFTVSGNGIFNVDYTTSGADSFNAISGVLTIPIGQTSKSITVTPISSTTPSTDKIVILSPSPQSGVWDVRVNNWTGKIADGNAPKLGIDSDRLLTGSPYVNSGVICGSEAGGFTVTTSTPVNSNRTFTLLRSFRSAYTYLPFTTVNFTMPANVTSISIPTGGKDTTAGFGGWRYSIVGTNEFSIDTNHPDADVGYVPGSTTI